MNNILITSAGRRVSLVKAFQRELTKLIPTAKVFACDLKPELSAGCQVAYKSFKVPSVNSKNYISSLIDICIKNKISLIVPTIDTELLILSENKSIFNKNGIFPVISTVELINKCRDKRKTANLFHQLNTNIPKQYTSQRYSFPLFIKPYDGSSSKDLHIIYSKDDLTSYHLNNDKFIFMEYLSPTNHDEYTIDLYYDRNSKLKCAVPRKRIETRTGEVSKGITKKNIVYNHILNNFKTLNGASGCITLQVFHNTMSNELFGIEINARFGGGFPLSYLAKANFPKWIIDEYFFNKHIQFFSKWEENLLMLRYDDEILIHDPKNR